MFCVPGIVFAVLTALQNFTDFVPVMKSIATLESKMETLQAAQTAKTQQLEDNLSNMKATVAFMRSGAPRTK
jgi:hypothetical protein